MVDDPKTEKILRRRGFRAGLRQPRHAGGADHEFDAGADPGPPAPAARPPTRGTRPVKLAEILKDTRVLTIRGPVDRTIRALRYDSRRVERDDVFFAWKGVKTDGHQVTSPRCATRARPRWCWRTRFRRRGADLHRGGGRAPRHGDDVGRVSSAGPIARSKMAGVTGTNGKTTTAFILKHLLAGPSAPVGLIGTVRYEIGERILPAARTTPESLDLHELLAQMKAGGLPAGGDGGFLSRARAGPHRCRSSSRSASSRTSRRTISIITGRWRIISRRSGFFSRTSTAQRSRASR